jgi:uncharacterized protein YdaU (DUF1376 family)
MKSPAFQFYPGDFLSDFNVAVLTTQEVGAYLLLMCFCWTEGSLPDDLDELSSVAKMDIEAFSASWDKRLKRCFVQEEGRWIHPRLNAERVKQQEFSRKMSEAAHRRYSGDVPRQRVGRKKAVHTQQVEGNALQSSSSTSIHTERVLSRYVELHPKRKVVGDKLQSIVRKALKDFSPEELIEALEGNASDPWHRERGKHELGYVLRDADKINDFRAKRFSGASNGQHPKSPDPRDGAW